MTQNQINIQVNDFYIKSIKNQLYTNRRRLESHLSYMFGERDLKGKNVLDVGGGSGLLSLYAAASGANAICLEPEFDGSTQNITKKFDAMSNELNLSIGVAKLVKTTFQDFESEIKFDVIILGIARRGVPRDRIALVPNGCDLGIFAGEVQPWRPPQVRATDLMAVFAGTHGMANGLDAVLNAAAELKRRGREDIKLVLIGQGKLKAGLQARAARDGLDNLVFHDPVNLQSIRDSLRGFFASPTRLNLPNKLWIIQ